MPFFAYTKNRTYIRGEISFNILQFDPESYRGRSSCSSRIRSFIQTEPSAIRLCMIVDLQLGPASLDTKVKTV